MHNNERTCIATYLCEESQDTVTNYCPKKIKIEYQEMHQIMYRFWTVDKQAK